MDLKEKMKQRRTELGLTLDEVAKIVGVSGATISRWESGDIENMRRDKIALLAKALQVSPAFIMGWSQDFENSQTNNSKNDVAFFRLKKGLEPYDVNNDDVDFLLTVLKAHKEKNQ